MIQGLVQLLDGYGQPGIPELRALLLELLDGPGVEGRLVAQRSVQPRSARVFRLEFDLNGETRRVIAKRLTRAVARRSELVARRWLPAVGLSDHGPALLGDVAALHGNCVWHVYEDLGNFELDVSQVDREKVCVAIDLIARLHARFARHRLLGEVRLHGGDLGVHFLSSSVRDAAYALEACQPPPQQAALHGRLLQRLYGLRRELPSRAQAVEEFGGPETLLHGDLWAINVFVIPTAGGLHARLIDWDHTAVGPASYDVSTFLLRFPPGDRSWVLDAYCLASRAGWCAASPAALNYLFETAECARIVNCVIWPAIALAHDRASWGWDALVEVDQWFEQLAPVLPCEVDTGPG